MAKKSEKPDINYTLIAVFTEDEIMHKTFETLDEVNTFIENDFEGSKGALIFVIEGTLLPESQWRRPGTDETYWVII